MRRLLPIAAWIVGLHTLVTALHGAAHVALGIPATALDDAFRMLVIALAPLVALGIMARGQPRAGAALLAGAMCAAWVYGAVNHFILPGDDHAVSLVAGGWATVFAATASVLFALEAAGTFIGVRGLFSHGVVCLPGKAVPEVTVPEPPPGGGSVGRGSGVSDDETVSVAE